MSNILDKIVVGKEEFVSQTTSLITSITNLKPSSYVTEVTKQEVGRNIIMTIFNKDTTPQYRTVEFQYGFTSPTFDIITGDPATNTILTTYLTTNYITATQKGAANGVATLNAEGKIDPSQIAGAVAQIKEGYYYNGEFYQDAAHTILIQHNTAYVYYDLTTNKEYRWGGTQFIEVLTSVSLNAARDTGTTATAYRSDFGAANYADIVALQSGKQALLSTSNKLNTTYIDTDTNARFVSDAEKNTWNLKQDALVFDELPTENSNNPVKSKGIKSYIDNNVVGSIIFKGTVATHDDLPTILTQPDIKSGWEYSVLNDSTTSSQNALYAAVVTGTAPSQTLSWNFMGNTTSLSNYIQKSEKDAADGVAKLDSNKKILETELPDWLKKAQIFGGVVNNVFSLPIVTISSTLQQKLGITDTRILLVNSATDSPTEELKSYGYATLEGVFFNVGSEFEFISTDFKVGDMLVALGTSWAKIDHTIDLSGKLDKINTASIIYATDSSSTQTSIAYTSANTASTVMVRDNNGRAQVSEPNADNDIVNNSYLIKRVKNLTSAPNTSTAGVKGQLALFNDGTNAAKVYYLKDINTSVEPNTYSWEEITNQSVIVDGTSILNSDHGIEVSYGGQYTSNEEDLMSGITSGTSIDTNIKEVTSTETPQISTMVLGDNIVGDITISGVPYTIDKVVESISIVGDGTGTTFTGVGIKIFNDLFFVMLNNGTTDYLALAKPTGDISATIATITVFELNKLTVTTETIKPQVVPIDTDYLKINDDSNISIKIDSTLSTTSTLPIQNLAVATAINGINEKIPSAATSSNQLADKAFVSSNYLGAVSGAVSTNTNFTGTLQKSGVNVATTTDLNSYLPLAGGTLVGDLTLNYDTTNLKLKRKNANTGQADLSFIDSADVRRGCIRYNGNLQIGMKTTTGENWWNGGGLTIYDTGATKLNSTSTDGATYYNLDLNNNGTLKWRGNNVVTNATTLSATAGTNVGIARPHFYKMGNMVFVNCILEFSAQVSAWNNLLTGLPTAASADQYFACWRYDTNGRYDVYVSNTRQEIQSPNTIANGAKLILSFQYLTNE